MTTGPRDVLDFWFAEIGEDGWFSGGDAIDARIRDRFLPSWEAAMEGRLGLWLTAPPEALAYVILLDQFPRNMFRGRPEAFASDRHARAAAKAAIGRDWDLRLGSASGSSFTCRSSIPRTWWTRTAPFGSSRRGCRRRRIICSTRGRTARSSAASADFPAATPRCAVPTRPRSRLDRRRRLRGACEGDQGARRCHDAQTTLLGWRGGGACTRNSPDAQHGGDRRMASRSFDLIVIGAGPGGYVAAIRAAQNGQKVVVVEREHLGGICLNWGCIPTKALLRSAEVFHLFHRAKEFGLTVEKPGFDFDAVIQRSRGVAKQLSGGVRGLLKKNKIEVVMGAARLAGRAG
jgi:hypothetical protein